MKNIFLSLFVTVLSFAFTSSAYAVQEQFQGRHSCNMSYRVSKNGVTGYHVDILSDKEGKTFARISQVCERCLGRPGIVPVEAEEKGMLQIFTGSLFRLTISLESYLPTRIHHGTLEIKGDAEALQGLCRN